MDGLDISNARKEDGVDGLERLPQGEINLDVQRHVDGYAVLHSRTEFPLLQRSNSVLIQSQTQASHNLQDLNRAILADDSRQNHDALILGFACFFGVGRLHAVNNRGCADTSTNPKDSATDATAFAGPDAATLAWADPTTCTCSDATAGSWSAGRRPGNTQWITEVGNIEIGKRVELRYHDGGLHSQYGIQVDDLRRWRRELLV